jgi:hypothetical protein
MDRDSRRLSHGKGSKIITQTNVPLSSDGGDGDQLMVGSTLYTKSQGRWMPFKSGGGNINDGWHGSQKYVRLLPKDFMTDNEAIGVRYFSDSVSHTADFLAEKPINPSAPASGSLGVGILGSSHTENKGLGAFMPIPLGYWAIACKIYCSHTIAPSGAVTRLDGTSESGTHSAAGGVMIYEANLTNGQATSLMKVQGIQSTNQRIVFDTAMLGQEQNYCHIHVNDFTVTTGIYGGYIELRRVKTAAVIAEEESDTGGDSLPRGG